MLNDAGQFLSGFYRYIIMFVLIISVACVAILLLIIATTVRISLELIKIRRKGLSLGRYLKPVGSIEQRNESQL